MLRITRTDNAPTAGLTEPQPAQLIPPIANISFADDLIGSGHQVIDILQSWFGLERTEELGEERLPLPAVCVEVRTSSELAFVFCAGLSDGPEELQLWLTSLYKLTAEIHVEHDEDTLPSLGSLVSTGAVTADFEHSCHEIGIELLLSNGYVDDKAQQRGSGYGSKGLLVAFP